MSNAVNETAVGIWACPIHRMAHPHEKRVGFASNPTLSYYGNRLLFHNQFFSLHALLALDRDAIDTGRKVEVQLTGFTCSHIA